MSEIGTESANTLISLIGLLILIVGAFLGWVIKMERHNAKHSGDATSLQDHEQRIRKIERKMDFQQGREDERNRQDALRRHDVPD